VPHMVGLLALAHDRACEAELADALTPNSTPANCPLSTASGGDSLPIPPPVITVKLAPLHFYDELGTVRLGEMPHESG
jgi:hypothetical protein